MTASTEARSGSIGVGGLLGVLFVGLKLTGYIGWSWWWVLAPFWAPFAIILVLLLIAGFVSVLVELLA